MILLKLGSVGQQVHKMQDLLNALHATQVPLKSDGIFGPMTQAAVRAFQQSVTITADGIVGPITTEALLNAAFSAALKY